MKRALVLSAGSSWAAYQAGALAYLVDEESWHFDVVVGTGIGAMHAALVGCGEHQAIQRFWKHAGTAALVRPRLRGMWRLGPLDGAPQRRFLAAHVSESRLEARGVTLLVAVMDLVTGQEHVLTYPGDPIPLVDGLMAAVATPGLIPPRRDGSRQLAESTFLDSVPLRHAMNLPVDEIVAVLPVLPVPDPDRRAYRHWRAVLGRALAMNLARDARAAVTAASATIASRTAFRDVANAAPSRVADAAGDERLRGVLEDVYRRSRRDQHEGPTPRLVTITPERDLGFALWQFPQRGISAARIAGHEDAERAVHAAGQRPGSQRSRAPAPRANGGVGLFLTPGAARSAYQVGALQALVRDAGMHFDVIAASSVGALNGAFAATGQVDELARLWASWVRADITGVDAPALARGGVLWASNLLHNRPQRDRVIRPHISEQRLLPNVRFRINLADITTGNQEIFEWPGAPIPPDQAVDASVAVPAAIRPHDLLGRQWVDGLTVDGFPLEETLLSTGVSEAFVVGVAPRTPTPRPVANAYQALLRALEWNQYSETILGLQAANEINARVLAWRHDRQQAHEAVVATIGDQALRARLAVELDAVYDDAGFPYDRDPVTITPLLPEREIEMFFIDYQPERSRQLLALGRRDTHEVLRRR